jgi:hypothetical protein
MSHRKPTPILGDSAAQIAAIKFLNFYSSWNEDGTRRFLNLQFELPNGPFYLTIDQDDKKFTLSHLLDRVGNRLTVCAYIVRATRTDGQCGAVWDAMVMHAKIELTDCVIF